jgi:GT2 family glycosyltransferase
VDVVPGLVSVVIATYNRSNVLRLAMESVRWQTYPQREIIVVGDCCTDDTADVVASFGDPAIRFDNLPDNFGEQSAPNNFGCRHARGEFIAFLNHDDLYLPRHLANAVGLLREAEADLVFARRYSVDGPEAPPSLRPPVGRFQYDPGFSVPASCWVFRRGLVDEIGPWRPAAELYNYPSQDWLFRVFKAGKTIRCTPEAGVIVVSSLVVDNTYRARRDIEQRTYYERLRSNRDYVPAQAAAPDASRAPAYKRGLALLAARRSWKSFLGTTIFLATIAAVRSVSRVIGHWAHPATVYWFVVGRGRRAVSVETLRHRRGLPDRKLSKEHSHE